jgi:hypothetical protein
MIESSMLSKYDVSDETFMVDIFDDESNEPIAFEGKEPFQIEIVHVTNPQYKKDVSFLLSKNQAKKRGKKKDEAIDLEEAEEFNAKLAAKLTRGWKNLYDSKGDPIPFAFETAVELYQKFQFIQSQVSEAAQDRANFTKSA